MLDEKTISAIADLARLGLTDREVREMAGQLVTILNHFKTLDEINLNRFESNTYDTGSPGRVREDKKKPSLSREALLDNTPHSHEGLIRVPKVIE